MMNVIALWFLMKLLKVQHTHFLYIFLTMRSNMKMYLYI